MIRATRYRTTGSVVDPHRPEADPDPTFHPDGDPDTDSSFQIKAQTPKKVLKLAHIPHVLASHLQIDADPDLVPDPAYHFDADPDPYFYLMQMRIRMRIQITKMMRIRIHNTDNWYIKA